MPEPRFIISDGALIQPPVEMVASTSIVQDIDPDYYFLKENENSIDNLKNDFGLDDFIAEFNQYFNEVCTQTPNAEVLEWSETDLTSRIGTLLDCLSQNTILIPQRSKVRDYLISHLDLAGKIPAICLLAKKRFKTEAQLSLEMYVDPEIDDGHLKLYIRPDEFTKEIFKKIEEVSKVSSSWIMGISGWIHVSTDKVCPS